MCDARNAHSERKRKVKQISFFPLTSYSMQHGCCVLLLNHPSNFSLSFPSTTCHRLVCVQVLLMERMYMRREMYLSIMMDRASQGPVIVACPDGGTSIEDLAESNPELILKVKTRCSYTSGRPLHSVRDSGEGPGLTFCYLVNAGSSPVDSYVITSPDELHTGCIFCAKDFVMPMCFHWQSCQAAKEITKIEAPIHSGLR